VSDSQKLGELIAALARPSALVELAVLGGCLLLAWGVVRVMSGRTRNPRSIWFGERLVDGVLFPVLALGLALLARWALSRVLDVAVFRLAVPVLLSLVIIRVGVRVLRVAFPASRVVRIVERTLSWLVWIGLVLWLTGLLPLLLQYLETVRWKAAGGELSLRNLIEAALSAVVVMVLVLWLSAAIETRLLGGSALAEAGSDVSVRKMAANATRVVLIAVGLLVALSVAGIPLGVLSVFGGAVGVGIGFGLQKLAANYVSGFVILAERSLRIGDMVKVDNFEGRITDISTRYTVIRSLGGREALVPNEMLITQRVESFTLGDPKVMAATTLQVAYGTDIEALIPRLCEAVAQVERVLDDPAPGVALSAFAADGLELTVSFWIADSHLGDAKGAVNLALLRKLGELGIEIPYPQRVVHLQRKEQGA
jgi:small-conductance mechanosensitive channel